MNTPSHFFCYFFKRKFLLQLPVCFPKMAQSRKEAKLSIVEVFPERVYLQQILDKSSQFHTCSVQTTKTKYAAIKRSVVGPFPVHIRGMQTFCISQFK